MGKNKSHIESDKAINQKMRLENQKFPHVMDGVEPLFIESEWEDFINRDTKGLDENISKQLLCQINKRKMTVVEKGKSYQKLIYILAAAALLLVVFGISFYNTSNKIEDIKQQGRADAEYVQVININRTDSIVNLPDGSKVRLGSNSRLSYLRNFSKTTRDILLHGTASFEVVKDSDRPFSVECNGLVTVALGTIFTIKEESSHTEVYLARGRIKVYVKDKKQMIYYLDPGDKVYYQSSIKMINYLANPTPISTKNNKVKENSTDNYGSYEIVGKEYIFKNIELKNIFKSLEKIYSCEISYPQNISHNNMYISVDTNQSLNTVLKNIALLSDLQLEVVDVSKFNITYNIQKK